MRNFVDKNLCELCDTSKNSWEVVRPNGEHFRYTKVPDEHSIKIAGPGVELSCSTNKWWGNTFYVVAVLIFIILIVLGLVKRTK